MVDQLNSFVIGASAQFDDGRYLANAFHTFMSEFGSFNMVYFFEIIDLDRLLYRSVEVYVDQAKATAFFGNIMGHAPVYKLPEGAVQVVWVGDEVTGMRAHLVSEQGALRELDILLQAPEPKYEYVQATAPLEILFGREGYITESKEWYTPAVPRGHIKLAARADCICPTVGQIRRAQYMYFGPPRPETHLDNGTKSSVSVVSRMD